LFPRFGKYKETLTTPNAGKDMEPQELSFMAGGNAKWYTLFGIQIDGFLQNELTLIIQSIQ
jgi:hypothetical protein